MSAREYFSLQIRRPQQISQPPIAEEVEIVGQNKNVIINEDDGKEYFLNEESGGGGGKRRHSSSFSSSLLPPNNQSKKLRNQPISAEVVTLEEDDEIETEDSETITEQNINSTTTDSTEISSQLQKKNIASTSLASTALMNAASAGGFTEHPSIGHSPIKSIEYKRTDIGEDNQVKSQQQQEELELRRQRRRAPILLDSRSLERAMGQRIEATTVQHPTPPLEQFLQSQYLLSRLQPFFEYAAAETQLRRGELGGKLNLQVKEYHCSPQQGTLTVTFPSHPLSLNNTNNIDTLNAPQQPQTLNHMIKMQLLVCPKDLRLTTKLEYCSNDLVLHHIENQEQADINKRINNALFTARLEMLNKPEEPSSSSILQREQQCCIWPCVRALLEGKHQ
uniref:Uncharacterized protein n=1 Tax=Meloidogyne javanica TaxID=6303 RepID=A0A915M7D5_MELJA